MATLAARCVFLVAMDQLASWESCMDELEAGLAASGLVERDIATLAALGAEELDASAPANGPAQATTYALAEKPGFVL